LKTKIYICRTCRRTTPLCEVLEYATCEDCWVFRQLSMEEVKHLTELEKESRILPKGGSFGGYGRIRIIHATRSIHGRSMMSNKE